MKAKIDKDGNLWIERATKMKKQACPFSMGRGYCGDHCSLFQEPTANWTWYDDNQDSTTYQENRKGYFINLCHLGHNITELTDERNQ